MAWGESRRGTPITLVAIHTNEGDNPPHLLPDRTAENLADWLTRENNAGRSKSYQTIVDDDSAVEYVPDTLASWSMRSGNLRSVSLCFTGWARWTRQEWLAHPAMLARGAAKVRHWCAAHGVPARKVNGAQIRAGLGGVCGHGDWSDSDLDDSTHTDPGPHFPWDVFMRMITEGDAMPSAHEIWDHVLDDPYIDPDGKKTGPKPARVYLAHGAANAAYAAQDARQVRSELAALKAALPAMVAEEVRAALAQGVVDVEVTVNDKTPAS